MTRAARRRRQRMMLLGGGLAVLALAAYLAATAMRDTLVYFASPTELLERAELEGERVRVGGLVEQGSIRVGEDGAVYFKVTDGASSVPARYEGQPPDLFLENNGVVADGRMIEGLFQADNVLARHDETYMPREAVAALQQQGVWRGPDPDSAPDLERGAGASP